MNFFKMLGFGLSVTFGVVACLALAVVVNFFGYWLLFQFFGWTGVIVFGAIHFCLIIGAALR